MKPYYEEAGITIYHGDCWEILTSALLPLPEIYPIDLVVTDPPYGIGADRNLRANTQYGAAVAPSRDYGDGTWDFEPPSCETISAIIGIARYAIIWGGNHLGMLPSSSCWLVWDKDNGGNGYADCELAWTNLPQAVRRYRYRWMGMLQEHAGALKETRWHPTQKPIVIMQWAIKQAPDDCRYILDPFMGSGTTLRAAKDLGRRALGIELEERYCEIAAKRLAQSVLQFD